MYRSFLKGSLVLLVCVLVFSSFSAAEGLSPKEDFLTVGNTVTFGRCEQNNNTSDGPEPIEWTVLDVKDGKALLLSRYGLDAQPYNTEYGEVTWETCTLRSWLNGDFLNAAFTEQEQAAVLVTDVPNRSGTGYMEFSTAGGNDTQDRIFLLSYAEAKQYLDVVYWIGSVDFNSKGYTAPTAYAGARGAYSEEVDSGYANEHGDTAGWWWLRSPGYDLSYGAYVGTDGLLSCYDVNVTDGTARPALWIDLEADIF